MTITPVTPRDNGFRTRDLIEKAKRRDDQQRMHAVEWMYNHIKSPRMSNKVKSTIAIITAAIAQVLRLWGIIDIPDFILDAATAVLAFVAGLFLPAPKQR